MDNPEPGPAATAGTPAGPQDNAPPAPAAPDGAIVVPAVQAKQSQSGLSTSQAQVFADVKYYVTGNLPEEVRLFFSTGTS